MLRNTQASPNTSLLEKFWTPDSLQQFVSCPKMHSPVNIFCTESEDDALCTIFRPTCMEEQGKTMSYPTLPNLHSEEGLLSTLHFGSHANEWGSFLQTTSLTSLPSTHSSRFEDYSKRNGGSSPISTRSGSAMKTRKPYEEDDLSSASLPRSSDPLFDTVWRSKGSKSSCSCLSHPCKCKSSSASTTTTTTQLHSADFDHQDWFHFPSSISQGSCTPQRSLGEAIVGDITSMMQVPLVPFEYTSSSSLLPLGQVPSVSTASCTPSHLSTLPFRTSSILSNASTTQPLVAGGSVPPPARRKGDVTINPRKVNGAPPAKLPPRAALVKS